MKTVVLGLLLTLWLSAEAEAQEAEASRVFRAAVAAHEDGDFEAAARAFEAAHDLVSSGAALYNAGVSWEAAGSGARAVDAFDRALRAGGLSLEQAEHARTALAARLPSLGRAEVRGEGQVGTRERAPRPAPATFVLEPGSHRIWLRTPAGATIERVVELQAGESAVLELRPEEPEEPHTQSVMPAADEPPPAPDATTTEAPVHAPMERRWGAWRSGWTFLGLGVATAGAAIGSGLRAWRARDGYLDSFREDVGARDRAARLRAVTNGLAAAASALGVLGLTLTLLGRERSIELEPEVGAEGARLWLRGRF